MQSISEKLASIIPPLDSARKKGENGRIAVIGGSYEFTGAPYYSAMGALKGGADMAHIFCPDCVATPIRSYSPEFVVHPVFTMSEQIKGELSQDEKNKMFEKWLQTIFAWERAITSWVIGPGLGRDKLIGEFFPLLIKRFKPNTIIVFDADGIYFLVKHPELFEHLKTLKAILTPNKNELQNLNKQLKLKIPNISDYDEQKEEIVVISDYEYKLPFSLIVKDRLDMYLNKQCSFLCTNEGSLKRCGGIGDILAGLVSTFAHWDMVYGPILACLVCRHASRRAFKKEGRGLTAPSVLDEVYHSFDQIEQKIKKKLKPNL